MNETIFFISTSTKHLIRMNLPQYRYFILSILLQLFISATVSFGQQTYFLSKESVLREIYYPTHREPVVYESRKHYDNSKRSHKVKTVGKEMAYWMPNVLTMKVDKVTRVTDYVYFGSLPRGQSWVENNLKRRGVDNVINLLVPGIEFNGIDLVYEKTKMNELRLPVKNHDEPSANYLRTAVEFLLRKEIAGQKTYVHCRGGHGRASAVALAYLMVVDGLSSKQAQDKLNRLAAKNKHPIRTRLYGQEGIVRFEKFEVGRLRAFYKALKVVVGEYVKRERDFDKTVLEWTVNQVTYDSDKDQRHIPLGQPYVSRDNMNRIYIAKQRGGQGAKREEPQGVEQRAKRKEPTDLQETKLVDAPLGDALLSLSTVKNVEGSPEVPSIGREFQEVADKQEDEAQQLKRDTASVFMPPYGLI